MAEKEVRNDEDKEKELEVGLEADGKGDEEDG